MWLSLTEGDRALLGLKAPPAPEAVFPMLAEIGGRLGRTPLLVFDQFDDYQSAYCSHFREGRQASIWITKDTLLRESSFWREVAGLLETEKLHCLFVTRMDSAAGLDTVRFVEPKIYRLDRLSRNLIAPLLYTITLEESGERPVVSHPERGWEQLKKRLLRDLERDGFILPAQMSVALQALRRLPALTVEEYERRGGSEGLERIHIERHIAEASSASGLSANGVRRALVALVDPSRAKTIQLSTSQILSLLGTADEASRVAFTQPLRRALDHLAERAIVRRWPSDGDDEDGWLLYHDYLCRGVLAAERRANRWQALLRERARQYSQTSGAVRRWRALLSPWEQIRFAARGG